MKYGSVCSGIEAATVAWHPLGWTPSFFSEIEKFPRAVLAHHWPEVTCHGDFTTIKSGQYDAIDLLVGGTPCQDFSVAGLRAGLGGDRGALTIKFLELAGRLRPEWLVWENVPGVLSADDGRAFGIFLGLLGKLGYGFAYRVLDAQYFGVPQRRRRVFVVGYLGDWRRAAAVLFERDCLSGNPAPRREAGQRAAPTISARTEGGGGLGTDFDLDGGLIARCVTAREGQRQDWETETLIAHSQRAQAVSSGGNRPSARGGDVIATPIDMRQASRGATMTNNRAHGSGGAPGTGIGEAGDPSFTVATSHVPAIAGSAVRRLTPRECERLQGFPDDYTLIQHRGKPAADGPRYKALGNSMAVPVMSWIGERIAMVNAL